MATRPYQEVAYCFRGRHRVNFRVTRDNLNNALQTEPADAPSVRIIIIPGRQLWDTY